MCPDSENLPPFPRLQLGVSSCLLGENVRYDGGHKRQAWLTDVLAAFADYIAICPEAGIGMGVPRPPIHLVGSREQPRALGVADPSVDVSEPLQQFALQQADALRGIDGYIFKKNSPSCGLARVKLFARPNQSMRRQGTGLYAATLTRALPLLPVEEEDAFEQPVRRDSFLTRAYVYQRWQQLLADGMSADALRDFHQRHRYLLMAHSEAAYRRLELLLSGSKETPADRLSQCYISTLMTTLKRTSQRRQHGKVLQRIVDHLKFQPGRKDAAAIQKTLDAFTAGRAERSTVTRALRRACAEQADLDVGVQLYLTPYPDSLELG